MSDKYSREPEEDWKTSDIARRREAFFEPNATSTTPSSSRTDSRPTDRTRRPQQLPASGTRANTSETYTRRRNRGPSNGAQMDSTEGRPVPPTYDRHRVPQPSDGRPSLAPSMVTHPGDVLPRTTTTRGSSNNRVNIKRGGDSASQDFPSDKSTLKPALRTKRPAFRSDNSVDFVPVDTVATAPPYQSPEPSPK